jgi:ATP-dependent helicase/nuclease subunit A
VTGDIGRIPNDRADRDRIRRSLRESLMVEAAAGTGKTTVLVDRLVEILRARLARPDQIVAVTFTRKAAGELKLRLRQALDRARSEAASPVERGALEDALSHLEEAHIGTIHSFCAELLRERPVEAGIDPMFEELAEDQAPALFELVFGPWIESRLRVMPEPLARLLSRSQVREFGQGSPLDQIRTAAWRFLEWRDFPKPWRKDPFDRLDAVDRLIAQVEELARWTELCPNPGDDLRRGLRPVLDLATWVRRAERERSRDYDRLEAFLIELLRALKKPWTRRKGTGFFAAGLTRDRVTDARDRLMADLERFKLESDADLAAGLQGELRTLAEDYAAFKTRAGRLDFVDLLVRTRDLIRDNRSVRNHFQERFSHVFVDEFQDTDPLQAEILLLLAAEDPEVSDWRRAAPAAGKLFLVGDPKQSIYRFRRADVLLYQQIKDRLLERGVGLVHLTRSFRAAAPLQQLVNAAFEGEMTGDRLVGQPDYVPLDEVRPAPSGRPAIVVLPVPRPYGRRDIANSAIEESLPGATGAFIEWLLRDSGWRIGDPDGSGGEVPIAPRHVAILFRRFVSWGSDVTRPYARELEFRGIPHVLVGSRSFHEREEVEALRAALTAVEWPDDELSLYATLRGTLFSLSDGDLFRYRSEFGGLRPFRIPEEPPEDLRPIADALRFMAELHRERNRRPFVRTLHELLDFTRAAAGFALRPAGHQVLANVQRLCDVARSYEVGSVGYSFRAFVEYLRVEAERRTAESPVLEEGVDGVRLTTVHGAKGLEFPVVVLADMTCRLSASQPDKFVDTERGLAAFSLVGCRPWDLIDREDEELRRDRAEGIRVAYVAVTRARDLLVVPGVGDSERDGWLSPMNKAVFPPPEMARMAEPAPGCPEFGESSVLSRPLYFDGGPDRSVRPGAHRPRVGSHEVVWWDPSLLDRSVSGDYGLRQAEILAEDEGGDLARKGLEEYRRWERDLERVRAVGGEAELLTSIVTNREDDPPGGAAVNVDILPRSVARPRGRRFGTLVHTVLRDVSLTGSEGEIRALAATHARLLDATPAERAAAVEVVERALRHPLVERAVRSAECRREFPLLMRLGDREVLEGTMDLAYRDGDGWVVVDFKTDAEPEAERPRYVRQIAWYAYVLERRTGLPVEAWLLGV